MCTHTGCVVHSGTLSDPFDLLYLTYPAGTCRLRLGDIKSTVVILQYGYQHLVSTAGIWTRKTLSTGTACLSVREQLAQNEQHRVYGVLGNLRVLIALKAARRRLSARRRVSKPTKVDTLPQTRLHLLQKDHIPPNNSLWPNLFKPPQGHSGIMVILGLTLFDRKKSFFLTRNCL